MSAFLNLPPLLPAAHASLKGVLPGFDYKVLKECDKADRFKSLEGIVDLQTNYLFVTGK